MMRLGIGFLALCLGACGGTETGNPSSTLQLALQDTSSDPSVASSAAGSALTVQRAWASFGRLRFVNCDASQGTLETGGLLVDLQAQPHEVALFDSAVSQYCGFHAELAPAAATRTDAPPELTGNALYLAGVRSDSTPFVLVSAAPSSLDLTLPAGQSFDASAIILAFDLGVWFQGVDVHGASPDPQGVARIDAQNNAAVLDAFDARRAPALSLYVDANHDADLQPGEATPLATAH